ncbi:WcaG Nucleoside-diphosphate-sugar epimerases [Burkholderiaceae bacterium]
MKARLLVVGGGGFIGQKVVERALIEGYKVTTLSPSGRGHPMVRKLAVSLNDKNSLLEVLQNLDFEYVVNCSGYVNHSLFFNGGFDTYQTHHFGLVNLLQSINRKCLIRFISIGSSDEYGDICAPQDEASKEFPSSPYACAKLANTNLLRMVSSAEGFPSTILRIFLTYGPGQSDNRFIPQIIRGCLSNATFPVSAGEQLRDFCFIDDVIEAIFLSITSEAAIGEVFNVASGEPIMIKEVVNRICNLVGSGKPSFGKIAYRPGENMKLYADVSKIHRALKWHPKISLEKGLMKTINFIRNER